jgi:hypothetical protein
VIEQRSAPIHRERAIEFVHRFIHVEGDASLKFSGGHDVITCTSACCTRNLPNCIHITIPPDGHIEYAFPSQYCISYRLCQVCQQSRRHEPRSPFQESTLSMRCNHGTTASPTTSPKTHHERTIIQYHETSECPLFLPVRIINRLPSQVRNSQALYLNNHI